MLVTARADSQQRILAGKGEGARVLQTGLAEASVLLRKIGSFGDPRLYALLAAAEKLSNSSQPLVPAHLFMAGSDGEDGHAGGAGQGLLGTLISLLVAEKSGFQPAGNGPVAGLEEMTERMTRDAVESMQQAVSARIGRAGRGHSAEYDDDRVELTHGSGHDAELGHSPLVRE